MHNFVWQSSVVDLTSILVKMCGNYNLDLSDEVFVPLIISELFKYLRIVLHGHILGTSYIISPFSGFSYRAF